MELWVRSQLKEFLIKVNDLRIMQLTEDGFEIGKKTDDWFIVANDDPCVGKYKSKERALKVLNEIQEYIEKHGETYIQEDGLKHYGNVYEMPEE